MIRYQLWKDVYARWWHKWKCRWCMAMKLIELRPTQASYVIQLQLEGRKLRRNDRYFDYILSNCVSAQLGYQKSINPFGYCEAKFWYNTKVHRELHPYCDYH